MEGGKLPVSINVEKPKILIVEGEDENNIQSFKDSIRETSGYIVDINESGNMKVVGRDENYGNSKAGEILREQLDKAIEMDETIEIFLTKDDVGIAYDSYTTHGNAWVDVGDIDKAKNLSSKLGAAILTHIFAEQLYAVEYKTGVDGYDSPHNYAVIMESKCFGAYGRTVSPGNSIEYFNRAFVVIESFKDPLSSDLK